MRTARWLALVVFALLALGACGGSTAATAVNAASTAAATIAPGGATPGGASASASGATASALPAGFPLPPGATVLTSVASNGLLTTLITVPSAKDAYDFYKGALPGAGYKVTDPGSTAAGGSGFVAGLNVTSSQYDGGLTFTSIGPNGQTVTIQLRQR